MLGSDAALPTNANEGVQRVFLICIRFDSVNLALISVPSCAKLFYGTCSSCKEQNAYSLGRVVQSTIKLTRGERKFLFQFYNFSVKFSV